VNGGPIPAGESAATIVSAMSDLGYHTYSLDNDYSVDAYVARSEPAKPIRWRGAFDEQMDLVFSRIDADSL